MAIVIVDRPPVKVTRSGFGHLSTGPDASERVTVASLPARRFVDIFDAETVTRLRCTYTTATGEFTVGALDPAVEHDVIAREDRHNRVFRDVIASGVHPVPTT